MSKENLNTASSQTDVICSEFAVFRLDHFGEYIQQSIWFKSIEEAKRYFENYNVIHNDNKPILLGKINCI